MTAKLEIHSNINAFNSFIEVSTDYFSVALQNKLKLLQWYRETKKTEVAALTHMYDELINNTETELADLKRHVDFLGLKLPQEATIIDGENANAAR